MPILAYSDSIGTSENSKEENMLDYLPLKSMALTPKEKHGYNGWGTKFNFTIGYIWVPSSSTNKPIRISSPTINPMRTI